MAKYGITRWIGDGSMPFAKGSHYGEIGHHTLDGRWKYAIHQGNGAYRRGSNNCLRLKPQP